MLRIAIDREVVKGLKLICINNIESEDVRVGIIGISVYSVEKIHKVNRITAR